MHLRRARRKWRWNFSCFFPGVKVRVFRGCLRSHKKYLEMGTFVPGFCIFFWILSHLHKVRLCSFQGRVALKMYGIYDSRVVNDLLHCWQFNFCVGSFFDGVWKYCNMEVLLWVFHETCVSCQSHPSEGGSLRKNRPPTSPCKPVLTQIPIKAWPAHMQFTTRAT